MTSTVALSAAEILWRDAASNVLRRFAYQYDAMGMITNVLREDDSRTAYTYEFLDRLTSETRTDGDATAWAAHSYDAAGNRTAKSADRAGVTYDLPNGAEGNRQTGWQAALSNDYRTAAAVTGWSTETIGTHPWLGQLYVSNAVALVTPAVAGTNFSVAAMPLGLGANEITAAIGDEAGNVGYASATVTVSIVTNAVYAYDAAGCLTNISDHAAGVESRTALAWNSRYELTAVKTNGAIAETYQYDALGRRVTITDGATTNWLVYDGPHVIAETDKNGILQKSYVYGPGIDNALAMTVHSGPSADTYYYLTDHLGTVHALANTNGVVVESYKYDAWGWLLGVYDGKGSPLVESAVGNRILWQGREYSWKTGLYYFRARWYDPVTGRWLSNDPIGISGGLNQYVAFNNNPVNFRDPNGKCTSTPTSQPSMTSTRTSVLIDGLFEALWHHQFGDGVGAMAGPELQKDLMDLQAQGKFPGSSGRAAFDYGNPAEFNVAATFGQVSYVNNGTQTRIVDNVYAFPFTNTDPVTGEKTHQNAVGHVVLEGVFFWSTPYLLGAAWPSQGQPNQ